MKIKRIFLIFTILIIILSNSLVFADLEDNEEINVNEVIETSKNVESTPNINSQVALIYDRTGKKILFEKNGKKQFKMASTTKIMTATVVLENAKLDDVVTIENKAAWTGGSRLGLKKDDKITVHDLLYGLLLVSGNDVAVALAIHVGGSVEGFAEMMNNKAKELGLTNTHFVTPHGLDEDEHYTTAEELAKMADYAMGIPKFKEIVNTKTYTVRINNNPKTLTNTNELLGSLSGVYGIKTGFTNGAGRCLVTGCKRGNLDIITVVLGADTKKMRTSDSIKLIEYAFKNFQVVDVEEKVLQQFEEWNRINSNRIIINKCKNSNIKLELDEINNKKMAIKNTDLDNITVEINAIYYFEAPLEKNQIIGTAKVKLGEEVIEVLNIRNINKIEKKQVEDYIMEFLANWSNMVTGIV